MGSGKLEDPLASTSFLDLISSALAAMVVLTVLAGAETSSEKVTHMFARVAQADGDSVNHLAAVVVGDLTWYTARKMAGGVSLDAYAYADGVCDKSIRRSGSLVLGPATLDNVFEADEASEFEAAVQEKYGITVIARPAEGRKTASIGFQADSARLKKSVKARMVYELCQMTPNPHVIQFTGRTSESEFEVSESYTFSKAVLPEVAKVVKRNGSTALCDVHNTDPLTEATLVIDPSIVPRLSFQER